MPQEEPPLTFSFPEGLEDVGEALIWQATQEMVFGMSQTKIIYQGPHRRRVLLPESEGFLKRTLIRVLEQKKDGYLVEVTVTLPMQPLFPGFPEDAHTETFQCEIAVFAPTSVALQTRSHQKPEFETPSSDGIDLEAYAAGQKNRREILKILAIGGSLSALLLIQNVRKALVKFLKNLHPFAK